MVVPAPSRMVAGSGQADLEPGERKALPLPVAALR